MIEIIGKNHLINLIGFMNDQFIPNVVKEKWSDNVKKEFLAQLHKFMISIT